MHVGYINFCYVQNSLDIVLQFGPWLTTKDHVVALSPLSPLGWGGEWKKKGKNS